MSADRWHFRIFIVPEATTSVAACARLRRLCETRLPAGAWEIEEIDLLRRPELAAQHQIVAIPLLERVEPAPLVRVIGDLSREDVAAQLLGLPEASR